MQLTSLREAVSHWVRKGTGLNSNYGSAYMWLLATLPVVLQPCKSLHEAAVGNSGYFHYGLLSEMETLV